MAKSQFSVSELVTTAIIQAIEAGTPPWRKPWTGGNTGPVFPMRSNGEPYRGINVLLLWLAAVERSYTSASWFTYKQAQELGAQVRKGEKSSTVVKFGTIEKEDDSGNEKLIPYTRAYRVFNADQIDGLPEHYYIKPEPARDMGTTEDAKLDALFAAMGVPVMTTGEARAYYSPTKDCIHIPPAHTFYTQSDLYGTLAHECAHATGHKSRLDRFEKFQCKKEYAFEELIAEIAASMMGVEFGFKPNFEQSAAYVEGWLKALGEDDRAIFRAAGEAQKAVDFIKAAFDATQTEQEAA